MMVPNNMWYPFYCVEETISYDKLSNFLATTPLWAHNIFSGKITTTFLQLYSDKIDNLVKTGYFFHSD